MKYWRVFLKFDGEIWWNFIETGLFFIIALHKLISACLAYSSSGSSFVIVCSWQFSCYMCYSYCYVMDALLLCLEGLNEFAQPFKVLLFNLSLIDLCFSSFLLVCVPNLFSWNVSFMVSIFICCSTIWSEWWLKWTLSVMEEGVGRKGVSKASLSIFSILMLILISSTTLQAVHYFHTWFSHT